MKKFMEFLNDENGQTSTEYILLVVVVAMIVIKFGKNASGRLDQLTGNAFNKMDEFLQSVER